MEIRCQVPRSEGSAVSGSDSIEAGSEEIGEPATYEKRYSHVMRPHLRIHDSMQISSSLNATRSIHTLYIIIYVP